jgi:hypothetical protein
MAKRSARSDRFEIKNPYIFIAEKYRNQSVSRYFLVRAAVHRSVVEMVYPEDDVAV